ncbi:MAG: hypothetical protein ACI8RA_001988 [Chlamydiales bacterium]|jgi:hypothetical protein
MVLISIPFSSQREQRQLTNVLRNFTEQYRPKFGSEGTEVVDTLHRSTLEAMFKKYSGKIEQEIKANVEDNPLTLEAFLEHFDFSDGVESVDIVSTSRERFLAVFDTATKREELITENLSSHNFQRLKL